MLRPRNAILGSLVLALLLGFFGFGGTFYKAAVGLDPSAFPLSGPMTALGEVIVPDMGMTRGGVALAIVILLLAGGDRVLLGAGRGAGEGAAREPRPALVPDGQCGRRRSRSGRPGGGRCRGRGAGLPRRGQRRLRLGGSGGQDLRARALHPSHARGRVEGKPGGVAAPPGSDRLGGVRHRARHRPHRGRGGRGHRPPRDGARRQLLRHVARLRGLGQRAGHGQGHEVGSEGPDVRGHQVLHPPRPPARGQLRRRLRACHRREPRPPPARLRRPRPHPFRGRRRSPHGPQTSTKPSTA